MSTKPTFARWPPVGAAELKGASAADLMAWTDRHFGGHYVIGVEHAGRGVDPSGRPDPSRRRCAVPHTGYHFAETIGTRDTRRGRL